MWGGRTGNSRCNGSKMKGTFMHGGSKKWRRERCSRKACGGFTLLETIIAMSVLFISMAGIVSAYLSCMWVRQVSSERALARNAAEQTLSAIRGLPGIVDAYLRFGGGGAEETFTVRGLQDPSPNEPVGRVIVWRRKSSLKNRVTPPQPDPGSALAMSQDDILAAQVAFSSVFPPMMDMVADQAGTGWDDYMDTNTDGMVNTTDDPQLMAVTVRIRWRSRSGITTHYFSAVVGRR